MKRRPYEAIFIASAKTTWELAVEGWVVGSVEYLSSDDVSEFLENSLCMQKINVMLDMQKYVSENCNATVLFREGNTSKVEQVYLQCFGGESERVKSKFFASSFSGSASLFQPRGNSMLVVSP